jgi:hypothetical protein
MAKAKKKAKKKAADYRVNEKVSVKSHKNVVKHAKKRGVTVREMADTLLQQAPPPLAESAEG